MFTSGKHVADDIILSSTRTAHRHVRLAAAATQDFRSIEKKRNNKTFQLKDVIFIGKTLVTCM